MDAGRGLPIRQYNVDLSMTYRNTSELDWVRLPQAPIRSYDTGIAADQQGSSGAGGWGTPVGPGKVAPRRSFSVGRHLDSVRPRVRLRALNQKTEHEKIPIASASVARRVYLLGCFLTLSARPHHHRHVPRTPRGELFATA